MPCWTVILRVSQIPGEMVVNLVSMKLCIGYSSSNNVGQTSDRLYKVCVAPLTSVCVAKLFFPDVQAIHAGILA